MRFTRFQAIILVAVLHVFLPVALVTWRFIAPYRSMIDWAATTLVLASYVLFIYLTGTWAFASYYLRYALLLVSAAAVLRSLPQLTGLSLVDRFSGSFWIRNCLLIAASVGFLTVSVNAMQARFFEQQTISLSFPLNRGVYSVFEGGNGKRSSLMNYHYRSAVHSRSGVNNSMKYAVDVTMLSRWGNDARGIFPRQRERYPVFNKVVLSPCDGVVAGVVDGQPNEEPWSGKGPYNLGNYVLLRTGNYHVLLGHLQEASIKVAADETVKVGEAIACVGNSGWTSQPHLHIQAMRVDSGSFWSGEGVPIVFDGRNPFKNRLFFR
jgi:hypothetical protein